MPPPASHPRKPLLGLRGKPGRLALAVFRMPLRAYRQDAGWLLAHVHGVRPHRTQHWPAVRDRRDGAAVRRGRTRGRHLRRLGPDTDWVRNLRAGPAALVRLGRESFSPQHRFLSHEEAFDVAVQFRREHPQRLRLLSTILGWGDLRDDAAVRGFLQTHPFVAFRPAATSPA
jgi:hypothetical protein